MENPNSLRPLFLSSEMVLLFQNLDTPSIRPVDLAITFQIISRLRAKSKRRHVSLTLTIKELQELMPFYSYKQVKRMVQILRVHQIVWAENRKGQREYKRVRIDDRKIKELMEEIKNKKAWERIRKR
ncbi:hypothetical protein KA005_74490 [bacterium]|nr:hypothetical protein [bacterium]